MKAEHRKELQTNLLADRMGRILQGVKGRPSRRGLLITVLLIVLGVVLGGVWLFWQSTKNADSERWKEFDQIADFPTLKTLADEYPNTQQGKSARMEVAWVVLWESGIKSIGRQPNSAFQAILAAKEMYKNMKEDCKDDPILGPECLYGIAVAEESLAGYSKADSKEQLDRALEAYKEVADTYKDSAHSVKARQRIEELENPVERQRIERFYRTLQGDIRDFLQMHGLDPKMPSPKK